MQKKLTLVSELDNILNNSLVCLVHENHVKEENPVYEFGYLTGSIDYIREETKEPNLMVSSTRTVYDIMENKLIEKPAYQGFYGEIFHIASVGSPRYFEYFSGLLSNDYTVDFDLPLFHISGKEVELESVEDINDDIVFTVRMRDGFAGTINVNNKGLDLKNNMVISNFKPEEIEKLFKNDEGYLILGEESGPIFLSKVAYDRFLNSELTLSSIGLNDDECYKMHPVLNIFYENEIVDTLLLNNELKDNKITRNRLVYTELFVNDDENIEYEVFETNSDAWDESFDFSESQDSEPDSEENIFLKAAEDILGAPIKFEADHDSPDSWDDDEEIISSSSLEDEFLNNIKDENIKNKNDDDDDHDEWDDEIDLGEDE